MADDTPARRLLVAGNWKMNGGLGDARRWARAAAEASRDAQAEVLLCPPYPWLLEVGALLQGSPARLGAQACHAEPHGAFTGGVSAHMLAEAGCAYVLCGHSERRQLCGETDQVVCESMRRAWEAGLEPLLCLGETAAQRKAGATEEVLGRQLAAALEALPGREAPLTLAYEPVWAIGTGVVATPETAQQAHAFLRAQVAARDPQRAARVRILYGGSVKADKIAGLLAMPDVDGALVGGASLDPVAFAALARARR
ncbi:MAG: triose-phosphate isomerase [Planctomycetia bacterium]